MRTIWQSLAWKEWHEHKWKLVSITAILWATAAMSLRETDIALLVGLRTGLFLCAVPLAVFVGLGVAAGERSRRTLPYLQSLPVPMWKISLTKLFFGWISLIIPALLAVGFILLWVGPNVAAAIGRSSHPTETGPFALGSGNWFVDTALVLPLIATSFYVWTIAAGVNRKDEVSAGAVALAVMVGWCALLAIAWNFLVFWNGIPHVNDEWVKSWFTTMICTAPGGFTIAAEQQRENGERFPLLGCFVSAISHGALAWWFIARFVRIAEREVTSPQRAVADRGRHDWLAPPRRSPFRAIAWKQLRESGPIVLAGVIGILGVYFLSFIGNTQPRPAEDYAFASITVGMLMALIVGVGVQFYDIVPQLNAFWRSRPINADLLFWTKFLSGLAILLAAIYGPLIVFSLLGDDSGLAHAKHPDMIAMSTLLIAVFAAAVAMTSLVRQPLYAAILSMAAMYFGIIIVWLAGRLGLYEGGANYIYEMTEQQVALAMVINFVVCTLIGWFAVRYDWGYKNKY
jgi:hypothetical protein